MRDETFFVMFPVYSETRKRDVITDNYLYPFFHLRHGDGLRGWQCWPVVGHEHKDVTTRTNSFGETEIIGGHDKSFLLWPILLRQDTGIGTDNPEKFRASMPFYAITRSPWRDSTSVLWPFFNWIRFLEDHAVFDIEVLGLFTRERGGLRRTHHEAGPGRYGSLQDSLF